MRQCGKIYVNSHKVSVMPQWAMPKAYSVKREWGVNPLRGTVGVCGYALHSQAKAGHWETEKAECMAHKCANRESQDLL